MATIKSYTDLSQSKKLAEILPLESADGGWYGTNNPLAANDTFWLHTKYSNKAAFPAWSLAALLNILAKIANKIDDDGSVDLSSFMGQWGVNMFDCPVEATDNYDNPVDACMAMIEKLNELKML